MEALRDVSFETRPGEFLSIVGPSGCGKTTLLRVLAGLLPAQRGAVEWIHARVEGSDRKLMVYQEMSLFPWMSVLENAAFGLRMQGVDKQEREPRALAMLARFGLAGRVSDYPRQLSVGMRQRVALSRCFLSDPALMLMDEPFAALDAQTRLALQQEVLALWEPEHRSVIFVTHDIEEAILLSDRILIMSAQPGTIVTEAPVPFPRPRTPETVLNMEFLTLKRRIFEAIGVGSAGALCATER